MKGGKPLSISTFQLRIYVLLCSVYTIRLSDAHCLVTSLRWRSQVKCPPSCLLEEVEVVGPEVREALSDPESVLPLSLDWSIRPPPSVKPLFVVLGPTPPSFRGSTSRHSCPPPWSGVTPRPLPPTSWPSDRRYVSVSADTRHLPVPRSNAIPLLVQCPVHVGGGPPSGRTVVSHLFPRPWFPQVVHPDWER